MTIINQQITHNLVLALLSIDNASGLHHFQSMNK